MGTIQDQWGNMVGEVDWNGTVRNRFAQVVGQVSLAGEVSNASDRVVGYAEAGGSIYDSSRNYIGRIGGSYIQNRSGSTVGMCDAFDSWVQTGGAALLLLPLR